MDICSHNGHFILIISSNCVVRFVNLKMPRMIIGLAHCTLPEMKWVPNNGQYVKIGEKNKEIITWAGVALAENSLDQSRTSVTHPRVCHNIGCST